MAWWRLSASFLGVLLLMACGAARAAVPLHLDHAASQVALSPHVSFYQDASGAEDVDTAIQRVKQGRFQPLPAGSPSFGFQNGAYWFHVRVVNHDAREPRWLLVQQYALSDLIDVYTRHRGRPPDPPTRRRQRAVPRAQHPLPAPQFLADAAAGAARRPPRPGAEPELDAGAAVAVHAHCIHRDVARCAVGHRHLLRHPAGAAVLQPGAVADPARRQLLLVRVPYHGVRDGAVHAVRPRFRVPVAGLNLARRQVGAAVDLPGTGGHAAVRPHLPRTARAVARWATGSDWG